MAIAEGSEKLYVVQKKPRMGSAMLTLWSIGVVWPGLEVSRPMWMSLRPGLFGS